MKQQLSCPRSSADVAPQDYLSSSASHPGWASRSLLCKEEKLLPAACLKDTLFVLLSLAAFIKR